MFLRSNLKTVWKRMRKAFQRTVNSPWVSFRANDTVISPGSELPCDSQSNPVRWRKWASILQAVLLMERRRGAHVDLGTRQITSHPFTPSFLGCGKSQNPGESLLWKFKVCLLTLRASDCYDMNSSLVFHTHQSPHPVHPPNSFRLTPLRFHD